MAEDFPTQSLVSEGADEGGDMPSQIGHFRVLGVLGEGGFGVVYEAEQADPKRRVALKVIKAGMDSKAVIARFEAERQALAVMDHPGVSRVYDGGLTDASQGSRPYFAMELVKGDPITEFCDKNRLGIEARVRLFRQVCEAVQHAHMKGVIHRDLKPSNILVTHGPPPHKQPIAKVIDFGVAKALTQKLTDSTIYTAMGQMIGTPEYMSPEQAEMSGTDIDTRSDVYSLGVILYELLTGRHPFDAMALRQAGVGGLKKVLRETEAPTPSTRVHTMITSDSALAEKLALARDMDLKALERGLKGELDWVVMKCLAKERDRRYESVNGLSMELKRFLDGEVVLARPPSVGYRASKFVKRNKVGVTVGVVLAVAFAGATGVSMVFAQQARAQAVRAEQELARTTEVKRLVTEMLEGLDPDEAQGADTTILKGILDTTAMRLTNGEIADELIAAELHGVVGSVYVSLGEYERAERHLAPSLAIRERVLGAEHPDTLEARRGRLRLYFGLGRWEEFTAECEALLELHERVLGPESPETLKVKVSLGNAAWTRGRFDEAEPIYLEALRAMERVLDPDHNEILRVQGNIAAILRMTGRLDEAEPMAQGVYERSRRTLGEFHAQTLWTLESLGRNAKSRGDLEEAERLLAQAVAGRVRALGDEHPKTQGARLGLAGVYRDQERLDEAEALYRVIIGHYERVMGPEYPYLLSAQHSLGLLFLQSERITEAVELYEPLVPVRSRVLGAAHKDTLWSRRNLGESLRLGGRHEEATEVLESLLSDAAGEGIEATSGVLIGGRVQLQLAYSESERWAEAERVTLELIEVYRELEGERGPGVVQHTAMLGYFLGMQDRTEDAIEAYETVRSLLSDEVGVPGELRWLVPNMLGGLYASVKRYGDAAAAYEETWDAKVRQEGEADPSVFEVIDKAWVCYQLSGQIEEAIRVLEVAEPLFAEAVETEGGGERARHIRALQALAGLYQQTGDTEKLAGLQSKVDRRMIEAGTDRDADANTLNAAAWTLLTAQDESLHDPELALGYAERACAMEEQAGGAEMWQYLDTLALAQHRTGDSAGAVETQRRAISVIPEEQKESNLEDFEVRLAEFEAGVQAIENESQGSPEPAETGG